MRELICKAKRKDNGKWIIGYYFCLNNNDSKESCRHFIIPLNCSLKKGTTVESVQVEILSNTICQYIGKNDIFDNPVFDGDIVKNYSGQTGVVEWGENCGCCYTVYGWLLESKDFLDIEDIDEFEVIGNKFDADTGGNQC